MQLNNLQQFQELLSTTLQYLQVNHRKSLFKRDQETSALSLDYSYFPQVANVTPHPVKKETNLLCTQCSRRISYKVNQFAQEEPDVPILVINHNPFFNQKNQFYQSPAYDKILHRMLLKVFQKDAHSFLVRDVLRCHFGKEEVREKEWRDHCLEHTKADLAKFKIRGILVLGQAAVLMFPESAELKARNAKLTEFFGVPLMVSSGPERIHYLMEKGNKEELQSLAAQIEENLIQLRDKLNL